MLEDRKDDGLVMIPAVLYESMVSRLSRLTAWVAVTGGATVALMVGAVAYMLAR